MRKGRSRINSVPRVADLRACPSRAASRLLLYLLLACQLALFLGGLHRPLHGSTDFRAFYGAGRLVLDGRGDSLYRHDAQEQVERRFVSPDDQTLPFLYPPFAALLFAPLAALPCKLAFACFTLVSFGSLLLASACLCGRYASLFVPYWKVTLCAGCLVPVLMSLLQGQISLVLLLLYAASHVTFTRERYAVTGLLLSLALIKWQIALPILFLLAVWRCWRVIAFAGAGAAGLFLVSLRVAGAAGVRDYTHSMLEVAGHTAADPVGAKALYGMFAGDMPNLHGLFFVLTAGQPVELLLTATASLAVLFWASRREASIPLALTAAMLVSYHMQAYDLTLLALPIGVVGAELFTNRHQLARPGTRMAYPFYLAAILLLDPVAPLLVWLRASWMLIIAVLAMLVCLSVKDEEVLKMEPGLTVASILSTE